ncbi:MAG: hypothetical protein OK438_05705 [Thaumarchaeota archaeon]|nr:hypothetical protein [Nitrososphaerota archaeon]
MMGSILSNVPAGTANFLSYSMLAVVALFLLSGPFIVYYYYRKIKKTKAVSPTGSA